MEEISGGRAVLVEDGNEWHGLTFRSYKHGAWVGPCLRGQEMRGCAFPPVRVQLQARVVGC